MGWSVLAEIVFFAGQVGAIALLVYGAWLCLVASRERPRADPAAQGESAAKAAEPARASEDGAWA